VNAENLRVPFVYPPGSAEHRAMSRAVLSSVAALRRTLSAVDKRSSPSAVHDARAAACRVRDAAAAFPGARLSVLISASRRLKAALGKLRDLQLEGDDPDAREDARGELREMISSWNESQPALLDELAKSPAPSKLQAERHLRARVQRLLRRISKLPKSVPAQRAHRLRMKLKRARGIIAVLDPTEKDLIATLSEAIHALGKLHDHDAGLEHPHASRRHRRRAARKRLAPVRKQLAAFSERPIARRA
jgi:CHAD domain-containing protein